jgi:hypothetical protein
MGVGQKEGGCKFIHEARAHPKLKGGHPFGNGLGLFVSMVGATIF